MDSAGSYHLFDPWFNAQSELSQILSTVSFNKIRGDTSEKFATVDDNMKSINFFGFHSIPQFIPMLVYNFTLSHCVVRVSLILAVLRE